MSVLAIVQARMGSQRLPGKVMADICGKPMIDRVLDRVRKAESIQHIIVATTNTPADDEFAAYLEKQGVAVHRGSEEDVLSRFRWAAQRYPDASLIVRITADDPMKDPALIDQCVAGMLELHANAEWIERANGQQERAVEINLGEFVAVPQYVHLGGPTWPLGLDVEVFTREALEAAYDNSYTPYDREHVTPYMAKQFAAWVMKDELGRGSMNRRYTVDTEEDLEFARYVYQTLGDDFTYDDMVRAGL
jgi:spore coat polysaccharide biosynthesis protein SpsF